MEYLETAYIADENAKYYNHFGKQLRSSFRIYGSRFHKLTIHLYRCHSFLKTSKKKTPAWSLFRPARLLGAGAQCDPSTRLAPGSAGQREVGEKSGARSACARTPPGSASRGPHEGRTLCAAPAASGREGVSGAEPGAAPAALAPVTPSPGPSSSEVGNESCQEMKLGMQARTSKSCK